jgi:3-hydroxymyristoyl/3-hydroxydecanoyl-(acyl carrier protein) dehydratase
MQSCALHFAADHPAASGHFPANPIIPGALLLDEVVTAIAGAGHGVAVIRAAKFLRPVRPGDSLNLRWQYLTAGTVKFECELAGSGIAVSGLLEMGPVAA